MVTKVELNKAGEKVSVYHEAGVKTVNGVQYVAHVWTHPYEEKETCDACTKGTIPMHIRTTRSTRSKHV